MAKEKAVKQKIERDAREVFQLAPEYDVLMKQYSSLEISEEERESVLVKLEQVSDNIEDRVKNLVAYYENEKAESEKFQRVIDLFELKKAFHDSLIAQVRDTIFRWMDSSNVPKIKLDFWTVWLQNNPPKAIIPELTQIEIQNLPDDLKTYVPAYYEIKSEDVKERWKKYNALLDRYNTEGISEAERDVLAEELKMAGLPPGFDVIQGRHLRIK